MGPKSLYLSTPVVFNSPDGGLPWDDLRTFFGATVCKTVRPMLSDRCSVCPVCPVLSVCNVGIGLFGQTVEWIKKQLGT